MSQRHLVTAQGAVAGWYLARHCCRRTVGESSRQGGLHLLVEVDPQKHP
jgi:hypothetical protein